MSLENLTQIFITQLNNPECSFLSGMFTGGAFTIWLVLRLFLLLIAYDILKGMVRGFYGYLYKKIKGGNK